MWFYTIFLTSLSNHTTYDDIIMHSKSGCPSNHATYSYDVLTHSYVRSHHIHVFTTCGTWVILRVSLLSILVIRAYWHAVFGSTHGRRIHNLIYTILLFPQYNQMQSLSFISQTINVKRKNYSWSLDLCCLNPSLFL